MRCSMSNVLCVIFDVLHRIISSPLLHDVQFGCKVTKKDSNMQIFFENYEDYTTFAKKIAII